MKLYNSAFVSIDSSLCALSHLLSSLPLSALSASNLVLSYLLFWSAPSPYSCSVINICCSPALLWPSLPHLLSAHICPPPLIPTYFYFIRFPISFTFFLLVLNPTPSLPLLDSRLSIPSSVVLLIYSVSAHGTTSVQQKQNVHWYNWVSYSIITPVRPSILEAVIFFDKGWF